MNIRLIVCGLELVFVLGVFLMFVAIEFPTTAFISIVVGSAIAFFDI